MNKSLASKLIAGFLTAGMVLSATACSSDNSDNKNGQSTVHISKDATAKTEDAGRKLDAASIYKNLTYTPEMFYGEYVYSDAVDVAGYIDCKSDAYKELASAAQTVKVFDAMESKKEINVSALPVEMKAGVKSNNSYSLNRITKYDWMMMKFPSDGGTADIYGAYTITDKTLSFYPLTEFVYDDSKQLIKEYAIAEKPVEYAFSFEGGSLNLKNGDNSISLSTKSFSEIYDYMYVNNFSSSKDRIDDIIAFDIEHSDRLKHDQFVIRTEDGKDSYIRYDNGSGDFESNGVLKFSYKDDEGKSHAYEYVYFMCGADGLVLADDKNVYYYNSDITTYRLGDITTDNDKALEQLSEADLAEIAKKKNNLQSELMSAFKNAGIKVSQNDETGEIMLDSSVLFPVGEYKLSNDGKDFLKKFLKVYGSVILKSDYEGFVSKIMVEGHTDSTGKHSDNLKLSQSRAKAVLDYCVSGNTGLESSVTSEFKSLMQAVGYADDYPVKDKNGKENKDASRRVSFKFVISIEK